MSEDSESKLKEYRRKILDAIEKDQIDKPAKETETREDEAQDPETPDYAVNPESGEAYGAEVKADPDPESGLVDERFSKSHEIDEASLRKTKKVELSQETDEPSDETPSE
jgi:hypothetical protein